MENGLASLDEFLRLSVASLESQEILWLNYLAALGLPGTENSRYETWCERKQKWGQHLKFEIRRLLPLFNPRAEEPTPGSHGNCLARFICWHMLRILQLHCGLKYNPDRKYNPDSCKPQDIFAHGIMDEDGEGGCCASMPVVYVAMGRYIGLPVYLVETRGHAFFRYDDPHGTTIHWRSPDLDLWIPPHRCNIEGSCDGIAFYTDDDYKLKPIPWQEVDYKHARYLLSMTAKEMFAGFLIERGECFWELGNQIEAFKAYRYALQLCPDDPRYRGTLAKRTRESIEHQQEMARIDRELDQVMREAESRRLRAQGIYDPRQLPCHPGHPAFGLAHQVPSFIPNHPAPHAIPDFHQPIPHIPGF